MNRRFVGRFFLFDSECVTLSCDSCDSIISAEMNAYAHIWEICLHWRVPSRKSVQYEANGVTQKAFLDECYARCSCKYCTLGTVPGKRVSWRVRVGVRYPWQIWDISLRCGEIFGVCRCVNSIARREE